MSSAKKLLVPAFRQYRHNFESEEFVCGYDYEETIKIVNNLQDKIENLRACLRTCASAANGGLAWTVGEDT
jgi:hypothetical protein